MLSSLRRFLISIFSSQKSYLQPRAPFYSKFFPVCNGIWYTHLGTLRKKYRKYLSKMSIFCLNIEGIVYDVLTFSKYRNFRFKLATNKTLNGRLSMPTVELLSAFSSRLFHRILFIVQKSLPRKICLLSNQISFPNQLSKLRLVSSIRASTNLLFLLLLLTRFHLYFVHLLSGRESTLNPAKIERKPVKNRPKRRFYRTKTQIKTSTG